MMEFKVLLLLLLLSFLMIAATAIALPLPQDDDGAGLGFGGLQRGKRREKGFKGGSGRGDKTDIGLGADEGGLDLNGDIGVAGSDLGLHGSQRGIGGGKGSRIGFQRRDDEDPKNNKNSGRGRDAGIFSKRGSGNRD